MPTDSRFASDLFPRASRYNPDWILAGVSGGANPLWLAEWLSTAMDLKPGMRVLDLGCGRALSSIFLHRDFGVQVWATDLWFNPSENLKRIQDAGVENSVFPIHANARELPFANEFFDAIVSIDSFFYYGTDDLYLLYLARFLKPGGQLGIAGAGMTNEIERPLPEHLQAWLGPEPEMMSMRSAKFWRHHWERLGVVDVEQADTMPDGWQRWLDWQRIVCPENKLEMSAIEQDAGRHIGYVRAVCRRKANVKLNEPIVSVPMEYVKQPIER